MFIEACVIPHLWYVIQGGRYHRQGGQHENKYTYEDIKTIADHKHDGIQGRKGGHAHGGARFVLNDVFPPEYQGKFIVGTIHHHGMYTESFERKGSGYVGKHVGDFMMANDPLYLGFNHDFGPDGGFYWSDWVAGWDLPKAGRIFRVEDPEASPSTPSVKFTALEVADRIRNVQT